MLTGLCLTFKERVTCRLVALPIIQQSGIRACTRQRMEVYEMLSV